MLVVDSHTEGEPTRVVVQGGPDLGTGPLAERLRRFAERHDHMRRAIVFEPRGSDAMVGALLVKPTREDCATGVIFFNNTGYLGMCGHGAIGVAVTLVHLGRASVGAIRIETPVGVVDVHLSTSNEGTVDNVPSYCHRRDVHIEVPGAGQIVGDIAWGGNWFFLIADPPCELELSNEAELTRVASAVRQALGSQGITGPGGEPIDHVEFFGAAHGSNAHSRNFVLCPGDAYDRSPCGTGTSAKLACLAERGLLAPGEEWVQESVIGSRFRATYRRNERDEIVPSITGRAYICAETTLVHQMNDPFIHGIV